MLNLTESYSPFSTTTFEALTLRGTLKANTHFEYQEILAPRIKGYPESHMPTCSHKKTQDRLTIPGHSYKRLLSKSLVLSFPNTPLTLLPFFS